MCLAPRYISGATAAPCSVERKRASPRATPWASATTGASATVTNTAMRTNVRKSRGRAFLLIVDIRIDYRLVDCTASQPDRAAWSASCFSEPREPELCLAGGVAGSRDPGRRHRVAGRRPDAAYWVDQDVAQGPVGRDSPRARLGADRRRVDGSQGRPGRPRRVRAQRAGALPVPRQADE